MKSVWLFPVGLLLGAAIAWALLSGRDAGTADSGSLPSAREGDALARAGGGSASSGRRREAGLPAGPDPVDPVDPVDPDSRGLELEGKKALTYQLALAAVDAIAGRVDAFVADVARAVETGESVDEIPGLVREFVQYLPEGRRAEAYQTLIENHPELPWDRGHLADLFTEDGDPAKAFDLLAVELETTDSDLPALVTRLIALEPARAAALLMSLSESREWTPDLLVHIASRLVEEGVPDLARPFLTRALEVNPSLSDGLDLLTGIDPGEAARIAEIATRRTPKEPSVWGRLAGIRLAGGDPQGAFAAYRLAAALEGDSDDIRNWYRGMLRADKAAALPVLQNMVDRDDDEAMGLLGRAYVQNRKAEEAFETYVAAHRDDRSDSEWLHRLVAIDPARAAEMLAEEIRAARIDVDDEVLGGYAIALVAQGSNEKAYEHFMRASQLDGEDYEWLRGLARTDPAQAVTHLESRLETEPLEDAILGALGDAYARLGRQADAIREYQKAIDGGENRGRWMAALALVDPARGLTMLRGAIEASPKDDELWGALGDAHAGLGQMDEARKAYDKALALDPSDWEWSLRRDHLR